MAGKELLQRVCSQPFVDGVGDPPSGAWADPSCQRVWTLERAVFGDLAQGERPADLQRLRTEAYRLACIRWEDRWAYGRVAASEELTAEWARIEGRWSDAWGAWRASWWIRRTLSDDNHGRRDLVMGALHLKMGRREDASERLKEAAGGSNERHRRLASELLQAVACGDRF